MSTAYWVMAGITVLLMAVAIGAWLARKWLVCNLTLIALVVMTVANWVA